MQSSFPVDSVIFDMDGTLWDAVDSYAHIWNVTLDEAGIDHSPVTRNDLLSLMGLYLDDIIRRLVPEPDGARNLLARVMENEAAMMPELGGTLYPNVRSVLAELAKKYRLFMVSNCGVHGLENFVEYNNLEPYFVDLLSHGSTCRSKAENITYLIDKYGLKSPVYVGDTQSDADSAHKAGIPFVFASYGFGEVENPDETIKTFDELPRAIDRLNNKLKHNEAR